MAKFNDNAISEIANSPRTIALVTNATHAIAAHARSNGPVVTGEYVDTIREELTHSAYRPVGKVIADCDHALIVEAKYGTLVRAVNSAASSG